MWVHVCKSCSGYNHLFWKSFPVLKTYFSLKTEPYLVDPRAPSDTRYIIPLPGICLRSRTQRSFDSKPSRFSSLDPLTISSAPLQCHQRHPYQSCVVHLRESDISASSLPDLTFRLIATSLPAEYIMAMEFTSNLLDGSCSKLNHLVHISRTYAPNGRIVGYLGRHS